MYTLTPFVNRQSKRRIQGKISNIYSLSFQATKAYPSFKSFNAAVTSEVATNLEKEKLNNNNNQQSYSAAFKYISACLSALSARKKYFAER